MADDKRQSGFSDHKSIGWIVSIVSHVAIILFIFYLPHFNKPPLEEAYEGVLVSFGLPIQSASSTEANQQNQVEESEELPEPEDQETDDPAKEQESSLTEDKSEIVVKKVEEAKPTEKKPTKKLVVEEEELEENQLDKAKNNFSQLFNNSKNKGTTPQQSGDPLGEPDASILEGISRGRGKVGGGLDERGVLFQPDIIEQSQKSGRVVVEVCVDKSGKVLSSKYTQKGSTTTDSELVNIAELSAMKYRFLPGDHEKQCGTITINFIVQ